VVEVIGRQQYVIGCNVQASELGVRVGQRRSAAQALASDLYVAPRQMARESEMLAGLAAWAIQFSPTVCLDPPSGLLIEISGCLRYFQGLDRLRLLVLEGLQALGLSAWEASAPTPLAASWLAQLGLAATVLDLTELSRILAKLALTKLPWSAERIQSLQQLGIQHLGQLMALPRNGLARRFPGLLLELDRALGVANDPRAVFVPPEQFKRNVELNWATDQIEALAFVAKRLLLELAGFLTGRGLGVQQIVFILQHEDKNRSELNVGFGKPSRAANDMLAITRERLTRLVLKAPVEAMTLCADHLHRLDGEAFDLFGDAKQEGDLSLLIARLSARMGEASVCSVACHPDHRPELAWRHVKPGTVSTPLAVGERPCWLLAEPIALDLRDERPWYGEPLLTRGRAERIETGWWDGATTARDYYQAEGPSGRRYWIYQLRGGGAWYLHGLFA
jgi:protein ImuB